MADKLFSGVGAYIPHYNFGWLMSTAPSSFGAETSINTATRKYAIIGRLWNKDHSAKEISSVGFRWGSVTKGVTTDVQVSIQGVGNTPLKADGVVSGSTNDCKVNVGNSNIVANTWINVADFNEVSSSIDYGEFLSVVLEYSTFNTGDIFTLSGITNSAQLTFNQTARSLYNGASWVVTTPTTFVNLYLKFSDGTYGCLDGSFIVSELSTIVYNSSSAVKEVAMEFTVDNDVIIDGCWTQDGGYSDYELILWEDNTQLCTVFIDNDQSALSSNNAVLILPFDDTYTLTPGKTYRISRKPSNVGNTTLYYYEVNHNDHFEAMSWGKNFYYNTHDGSNWGTPVTTRRLFGGIRVCGWPEGSGSSGEGKSRHMRG